MVKGVLPGLQHTTHETIFGEAPITWCDIGYVGLRTYSGVVLSTIANHAIRLLQRRLWFTKTKVIEGWTSISYVSVGICASRFIIGCCTLVDIAKVYRWEISRANTPNC